MKTFSIKYLGCKVNQYESQQIRQLMEDFDLRQAQPPQKPDVAIIHTCCVTHSAASKSRQLIRKALSENPLCKVIATGCLTSINTDELQKLSDQIYLVSREQSLPKVIKSILHESAQPSTINSQNCFCNSCISRTANELKIKNKNSLSSNQDPLDLHTLNSFKGQSRAFLRIQDGCDAFCTYCIIPRTRNKLWSNTPEKILEETHALIQSGHQEIVLTGIFLGAYGQTTTKRKKWDKNRQTEFVKLVDKIASVPGLKRLRLSSLEPGDVTIDLLNLFKNHDNLAPHLHLPLQAGAEKTLKRMNRQYTASEFKEMIDMVNAELDRPAITTDIIVGFPGETEENFNDTIEMAKYAKFAKIHVFPFSLRNGTAAEKMPDKLSPQIIKKRTKTLNELDRALQKDFRKQFAGEKISLIVENEEKQIGRCGRYFEVKLIGPKLKRGQFTYASLNKDCKTAEIL